jgi:hypothetical protein
MAQPTHKNLLVVVGEPPCTKRRSVHVKCRHYEQCKTQRQACKAFHLWVIKAHPVYWRGYTEEELYTPTDELYQFIYGKEDIEEAPAY